MSVTDSDYRAAENGQPDVEGVTGANSASGTSITNSNAIGEEVRNGVPISSGIALEGTTDEQLEARLAVLTWVLSDGAPPALKEKRGLSVKAARTGQACGRCGEAFPEGGPIYLAPLALGRRGSRWQTPVCEPCAPRT